MVRSEYPQILTHIHFGFLIVGNQISIFSNVLPITETIIQQKSMFSSWFINKKVLFMLATVKFMRHWHKTKGGSDFRREELISIAFLNYILLMWLIN